MKNQGDVLVTGTNRGLGKYCAEYFNGVCFTRETSYTGIFARARQHRFRAIIHAAFNPTPEVNTTQLYSYLNDTVLLTQKLLQIPHEKFIFISSADVYPKNNAVHQEDEEINLKDVSNMYAISKLISETIIRNESSNYLILRPTALLGEYAKKNSLMKILTQEDVSLTLAEQSTFNYVLHTDIARFIDKAIKDNLTGIYNVAATTNVTLSEVCKRFQRQAHFGDYHYVTGNIDNQKAVTVLEDFNKSSLENINLFLPTLTSVVA